MKMNCTHQTPARLVATCARTNSTVTPDAVTIKQNNHHALEGMPAGFAGGTKRPGNVYCLTAKYTQDTEPVA